MQMSHKRQRVAVSRGELTLIICLYFTPQFSVYGSNGPGHNFSMCTLVLKQKLCLYQENNKNSVFCLLLWSFIGINIVKNWYFLPYAYSECEPWPHMCAKKWDLIFCEVLGVERKHFLLTIYYITVNVLKSVTALKFQNWHFSKNFPMEKWHSGPMDPYWKLLITFFIDS